jgi:hypothetical protein
MTVGGTVTLKNTELVLSPIKEHVKNYEVNRLREIMVTPLSGDVGIHGAVATVLKLMSKPMIS